MYGARPSCCCSNDPGRTLGDTTFFKGKALSHYGTLTYKQEEAARQGAVATIQIFDQEMMQVPWETIAGSTLDEKMSGVPGPNSIRKTDMGAMIDHESGREILSRAGHDYDELKERARKPGFRALPLGVTMTADIRTELGRSESNNVIGFIPGTRAPRRVRALYGSLGSRRHREGDRWRQDLQRGGRQRHRDRGSPRGRGRVSVASQRTEAVDRPHRHDRRGAGFARLVPLRRQPGLSVGEDRRGDQHGRVVPVWRRERHDGRRDGELGDRGVPGGRRRDAGPQAAPPTRGPEHGAFFRS